VAQGEELLGPDLGVVERVEVQLFTGSGFCQWMKSGNFTASRMKKTPRSLPTRSQLPSSV